ncbi:MAG: TatD family hydrolase [Verrucomicrobiota bacterium]
MAEHSFYDAHCHWHDSRLLSHATQIAADLESIDVQRAVVNGTHPDDWDAVASLAERDPRVIPAFGLHPWHINDAPDNWLERLRTYLDRFPNALVGEVGLDRWIKGHDLQRQQAAFEAQLAIAAQENRPISIHCLQAWGPLKETLVSCPIPARGFHLHGYNGSTEMVRELANLGAYFSFSAYVMHDRKKRHRDALMQVPLDRLLVETDCPDMLPPDDWQRFTLPGKVSFVHAPDGESLHHPANINAAYQAIAEVTGIEQADLAQLVETNFQRFFIEDR